MNFKEEHQLLQKMELDFEKLQSGCCEMADCFGFEKSDKYGISLKGREKVLLPTLREANKKMLLFCSSLTPI